MKTKQECSVLLNERQVVVPKLDTDAIFAGPIIIISAKDLLIKAPSGHNAIYRGCNREYCYSGTCRIILFPSKGGRDFYSTKVIRPMDQDAAERLLLTKYDKDKRTFVDDEAANDLISVLGYLPSQLRKKRIR